MNIFRARLLLIGALVLAVAIVTLEFPLSELMHQRSALSAASAELSSVRARNAQVTAEIASLHKSSTIAAIAHEEYGLVEPGQRSYVILPAATKASPSGIAPASVPIEDLVAPPVNLLESTKQAGTPHGPSLVSRFVSRLEFWK